MKILPFLLLPLFKIVSAFISPSAIKNTIPPTTTLYSLKTPPNKFAEVTKAETLERFSRWNNLLKVAEYYYPQCTRDAVSWGKNYASAPPLIVKNSNETMKIFEWRHKVSARKKDLFKEVFYTDDKKPMRYMASHVILSVYNNFTSTYNIHGIVENPENILYEFSIHHMLYKLKTKVKEEKSFLSIAPLEKWCYGIYYFSLIFSDLNHKDKETKKS
tara:strand:+ start:1912 stop:2559 length:648 start_codon:yes stop_codon:yes gene_type:complete